MDFNSLNDVLVEELGDLYSAEQQLVAAMPGSPRQRIPTRYVRPSRLTSRRPYTVERLEEVFAELGIRFAPTRRAKR